jgi:hypothetical protein
VSVPGHEGGIRSIGAGSQDWRLVRQERPELLHSLLERRISSLKFALFEDMPEVRDWVWSAE